MNKISTYYHAFIIKIKNEIQIALSDHFVRRFHIFLHKHVPKKEKSKLSECLQQMSSSHLPIG